MTASAARIVAVIRAHGPHLAPGGAGREAPGATGDPGGGHELAGAWGRR